MRNKREPQDKWECRLEGEGPQSEEVANKVARSLFQPNQTPVCVVSRAAACKPTFMDITMLRG